MPPKTIGLLWYAFSRGSPTSSYRDDCGGGFLGEMHSYTAAHCLDFQYENKIVKPSDIYAYVGVYNLDKPTQALP